MNNWFPNCPHHSWKTGGGRLRSPPARGRPRCGSGCGAVKAIALPSAYGDLKMIEWSHLSYWGIRVCWGPDKGFVGRGPPQLPRGRCQRTQPGRCTALQLGCGTSVKVTVSNHRKNVLGRLWKTADLRFKLAFAGFSCAGLVNRGLVNWLIPFRFLFLRKLEVAFKLLWRHALHHNLESLIEASLTFQVVPSVPISPIIR